jgi:hypothetical protein
MPSKSTRAVREARHLTGDAILRGLVLVVVAPLIGPGGYNIFGTPARVSVRRPDPNLDGVR